MILHISFYPKYVILFGLVFGIYAFNSRTIDNIKVFKVQTNYKMVLYNGGHLDRNTKSCPLDTITLTKYIPWRCEICEDGKMYDSETQTPCGKCLPYFTKHTLVENDFSCRKCELGHLSLPDIKNNMLKRCTRIICSDDKYFDFKTNTCIKCSDTIRNSIGRRPNTLPLMEYCYCLETAVKIYLKDESICISLNQLLFNQNILTNTLNDGYYKILIEITDLNPRHEILFFHCHPKIRFFSEEKHCLCENGSQFINGMCKKCLISSISNNIDNKSCISCPLNEILSPDRSECLCPLGYERKDNFCVQCDVGHYKDDIMDRKCMKCLLFKAKTVGQHNSGFCIKWDTKMKIIIFTIIGIIILLIIVCASSAIFLQSKKKVKAKKNEYE